MRIGSTPSRGTYPGYIIKSSFILCFSPACRSFFVVVNNGNQNKYKREQEQKERRRIYFSGTEGVTIHLTDPTFAVNITGKVGGPVSSILANIFSLGKPKRGKDAKIIHVHSEKTPNFVTEFRMLCVQSDKHVIAADQVAVFFFYCKEVCEKSNESSNKDHS